MNVMETSQGSLNTTHSVLGFLQQQLESSDADPLLDVLGGLAGAFAVDGAGLGMLLEESTPNNAAQLSLALWETSWGSQPPDKLPWEKDALLLGRIKKSNEAMEVQLGDGTFWLIASVRQASATWILWLTSNQPRDWTQADKSCLAVAAECLVQRFLAGTEAAQWLSRRERLQLQEGINRTAAVTRRLTHDFCNILTSISGFAELALLNMRADSPDRRFVSEVLESARQGARWSQKLQLFSLDRPQRFLPTSLVAMLAEEQAKPDWHHEIALKVDLPPQLPNVAIEPESLRLALKAILDNAREAMNGHGIVSVAGRPVNLTASGCLELLGKPSPGPHVELTIRDTGVGLSADVQAKLFRDMFFTNKGRRRGLGLAVVYGIMQTYHGGFRLDSEPDRHGTTVKMLLPSDKQLAISDKPGQT
jgi:signal transduction histidine kinase